MSFVLQRDLSYLFDNNIYFTYAHQQVYRLSGGDLGGGGGWGLGVGDLSSSPEPQRCNRPTICAWNSISPSYATGFIRFLIMCTASPLCVWVCVWGCEWVGGWMDGCVWMHGRMDECMYVHSHVVKIYPVRSSTCFIRLLFFLKCTIQMYFGAMATHQKKLYFAKVTHYPNRTYFNGCFR